MAEERVIPQLNTADEYVELFKLIKAFKYVQENAEALGVGSYRGEGADRKLVISDRDIINFIVDRHTELAVDKDGRAVQLYTGAPSREELAKAIQNALKLTGSRDLREALNNLKDNENLIKESYVEFKNRQDADVNAKEENLIAAAQSTKTSQKANSKIKRQRGWARFGKVATVLATIGLAGGYVLGSFGLAGGFAGLASISTMPFATLAVVGGIIAYNVGKSIVKKIWKNLNDRIDKANAVIKGEADVLGSDKNLEQAKTLDRENARALNVARSRINAISPQNEAAFELFAEGLEDIIGTSRGVDIAVLDAPEIGAERVVSEAEREGTPPEVEVTPREIGEGEPVENLENTLDVSITREDLKAADLEDDRTTFNKVEVGIHKFESDPVTTRAAIRDYVRDVIYAGDNKKLLEDEIVDSIYNTFVDEYETGDNVDAVHSIETIAKDGKTITYSRDDIKHGVNDYLTRRLAPPDVVRALDISEVHKKHKNYYPISDDITDEKYNKDFNSHYVWETLHDEMLKHGIKEEDVQTACRYLTAEKREGEGEYMLPDSVKMPRILNLMDEIKRAEVINTQIAEVKAADSLSDDEKNLLIEEIKEGKDYWGTLLDIYNKQSDAEKISRNLNEIYSMRGLTADEQGLLADMVRNGKDYKKNLEEIVQSKIEEIWAIDGLNDIQKNYLAAMLKNGKDYQSELNKILKNKEATLNKEESVNGEIKNKKVREQGNSNDQQEKAKSTITPEILFVIDKINRMKKLTAAEKKAYAERLEKGESLETVLTEIGEIKRGRTVSKKQTNSNENTITQEMQIALNAIKGKNELTDAEKKAYEEKILNGADVDDVLEDAYRIVEQRNKQNKQVLGQNGNQNETQNKNNNVARKNSNELTNNGNSNASGSATKTGKGTRGKGETKYQERSVQKVSTKEIEEEKQNLALDKFAHTGPFAGVVLTADRDLEGKGKNAEQVHVNYKQEADPERELWGKEMHEQLLKIEKMKGLKRKQKEDFAIRLLNGESMDKILEEIQLKKDGSAEQLSITEAYPEAFSDLYTKELKFKHMLEAMKVKVGQENMPVEDQIIMLRGFKANAALTPEELEEWTEFLREKNKAEKKKLSQTNQEEMGV